MANIVKHSIEFLDYCKFQKNLSYKTIKAYTIDLKQFSDFVNVDDFELDILNIDKNIIKKYLQQLSKEYKVKSVKRKVACLKAFFNYLEYEDIILINPFRKFKIQLKEPFNLPMVMTLDEIDSLLTSAYNSISDVSNKDSFKYKSGIRDLVILELLFATGLRISELCNLKKNEINIDSGYVKVNGKGSRERIIYITNSDVKNLLLNYESYFKDKIDKKEYFFINRLGNRLSEQSVRFMVSKYVNFANIKKHITPHAFRHSFATLLLEEGVDIKYIQNFLGHSSIMTTQIYTHVTKAKQKEILSEKHPRKNINPKL